MTELSPEAQAIIDATRDVDAPTPADRQRVRAALFAQLGPATAASSTAATAARGPASGSPTMPLATVGTTGKVTLGLKVLAGIALVGGLGLGGYLWSRRDATATPTVTPRASIATAPVVVPVESTPILEPELGEPEIEPEIEPTTESELIPAAKPGPVRSSRPATARKPAADPPTPPPADPLATLREEKELIGGAKRALDAAEPERALALLAQHADRFEDGVLAQDRAGLQVLALCATGEVARAHREAASFLARWPHASMAGRVQNSCGGE